ncbi:succinate dehydrogenase cytochrome b subunit [Lapillicoccus jejuensis]|uniref:Succinate dehydrogenase subunit C n=1 Tax=Lapillicoccus jejuensis TaxID=402171 RepID=A0A542E235_9MICO|nr:succinate dehydrogenase cytochrome b subunit [Lapillicoccus jejuensis]TQJ09412.1 succinate dehydrogenase subunit C [Lapillicoccus jejuensis]
MATSTLPATITARRTTIAMKMVMATTGIVFVLFVLAHMYGNLKMFGGQAAYDEYAHHLRTLAEPIAPYSGVLWVLRVVLLGSLVAHVYSAFYLWSRAQSARSTRYQVKKAVASTLSAKFMRWGGVTLLLFIVFHILQFTTQTINVNGQYDSPYRRYVSAFQPGVWWVFVIYALAMVALAMHIRHGVWSASQTLGWTGSATARRRANLAGYVLATVVSLGFILPPIFVLVGAIK